MTSGKVFAGLEPAALWDHFSHIVTIPRPSGHESAMADYVVEWAKSLDFPFHRDAAGNLCVRVPPSKNSPGPRSVALQAHLDMVCVRAEGTASDPAKGIIEVSREGPWTVASNSTLGADNGIGVAAAMAIAEAEDTRHGPLELLFTVEEETTCKGADSLEPGFIRSGVMVNLDAEKAGVLEIGSAGGTWSVMRWPSPAAAPPDGWLRAEISISGLRGGHSGFDIGKNRLNAIKGVVWALRQLAENVTLRLCALEGGDAINAIPIHARATVAFPSAERGRLEACLASVRSDLVGRFAQTDPGLSVSWVELAASEPACWSEEVARRMLDLLAAVPSGVLAMEQHASDLVETSNNLGIVALKQGVVEVHCLSRSSVPNALEETVAGIESAARLAGAEFAIIPPVLPPWRIADDSALLGTVRAAYRECFQDDPRLVTVHAGSESGLIQQRIPGLEIVSLGPEIQGAHMPGERVNIPSVADFYVLLLEVLQRLAR